MVGTTLGLSLQTHKKRKFMRKKNKNKTKLGVLACAAVFVVVFLSAPHTAHAANLATWFLEFMSPLLLWFNDFLRELFEVVLKGFLMLIQANNFMNVPGIQTGWKILRDLGNMTFILIMLGIAFGTILRIEAYKWQRMLPKLIFAAIMVNFSKTIALILIDVGQVVMFTFVSALKNVAVQNFNEALKLTTQATAGLDLLPILMSDILYLVAGVVVVAMSVVMIIRIIILWILVTTSPIAFLADVLSFTQKYSKQWWSEFTKYVVIGPIFAFFLWFSFLFVGQGKTPAEDAFTSPVIDETNEDYSTVTKFGNELTIWDFVDYGVAVALLLLGLSMAQKMGVKGGKAAVSVGKGAWGVARRELMKGKVAKTMLKTAFFPAAIANAGLKHFTGKGVGGWIGKGIGTGMKTKEEIEKQIKDGGYKDLTWKEKSWANVFSKDEEVKKALKTDSGGFGKTAGFVAGIAGGAGKFVGGVSHMLDVGTVMLMPQHAKRIWGETSARLDRQERDSADQVAKQTVDYARDPLAVANLVEEKFSRGSQEDKLKEIQKELKVAISIDGDLKALADKYIIDEGLAEFNASVAGEKAEADDEVNTAKQAQTNANQAVANKSIMTPADRTKETDARRKVTGSDGFKDMDAETIKEKFKEEGISDSGAEALANQYIADRGVKNAESNKRATYDGIDKNRSEKTQELQRAKDHLLRNGKESPYYEYVKPKHDRAKGELQRRFDQAAKQILTGNADLPIGESKRLMAGARQSESEMVQFTVSNLRELFSAQGENITVSEDGRFAFTNAKGVSDPDKKRLNSVNAGLPSIVNANTMDPEAVKGVIEDLKNGGIELDAKMGRVINLTYQDKIKKKEEEEKDKHDITGAEKKVKDAEEEVKKNATAAGGEAALKDAEREAGETNTVLASAQADLVAKQKEREVAEKEVKIATEAEEKLKEGTPEAKAAAALAVATKEITFDRAKTAVTNAETAVTNAEIAAGEAQKKVTEATEANVKVETARSDLEAAAKAVAEAVAKVLAPAVEKATDATKTITDRMVALIARDSLDGGVAEVRDIDFLRGKLIRDLGIITATDGMNPQGVQEAIKVAISKLGKTEQEQENAKKFQNELNHIENLEKLKKLLVDPGEEDIVWLDPSTEDGTKQIQGFEKKLDEQEKKYFSLADARNEKNPNNASIRKTIEIAYDLAGPDEVNKKITELQRSLEDAWEKRHKALEQEVKIKNDAEKLFAGGEEGRKAREENQKKIKRLTDEQMKQNMKLLRYRREQDMEARRYNQRLVEEEKGKITSDNSDELIADLHLSKEKGDHIREQAIVKKLAENGDFNDLMDYLKFPSNMAGMHKFFNEWLIGGSKINKQIAFGLENDISYILERANHWNFARAVNVRNGQFVQASESDQLQAVMKEGAKRKVDIIRSGNRLAYGYTDPNTRKYQLTPIGTGFLKMFARDFARMGARSEVNTNAEIFFSTITDIIKARVPELSYMQGDYGENPYMERLLGVTNTIHGGFDGFIKELEALFQETFQDDMGASVFVRGRSQE